MGEVFKGYSGTTYITIDPALGSGGEGTIYGLEGMLDKVAKVYKNDKRNIGRERKLFAMIASPLTQEAMKQVAWPIDVIYQNNQFVGFIMPRIVFGEDLNVMYDYTGKYKNATLSTRIAIARNLCAAVNAVHNAKQVCGDLNPKNISVNPVNGIITLVDTDSYHITDQSGKVYRCEVGLPPYLAREIQDISKSGKNLANALLPTYTPETDRFALAVHIFQLLMNGCLPFATAIISSGNYTSSFYQTNTQASVPNPQPSDNISSGSSPFFSNIPGLTIPVYAPPLTVLPKEMQDLFKRAFVAGHHNPKERPTPVEWFHALINMSQHLKYCNVNSNHEYSDHLMICPWCDVERKIGLLTGSTTNFNPNTSSTNISQNPVYVPPPISSTSTYIQPPTKPSIIPQPPVKKKRYDGWIAVAVIVIVVIWLIIRSISSINRDIPTNSGNVINHSNTTNSIISQKNNSVSTTQLNTSTTQSNLEKTHTYEAIQADVGWEDAKSAAENKGGYLATINSLEEFNLVTSMAFEKEIRVIWVGANRGELSDWNKVKWITGEPIDYLGKWFYNPNTGISEPSLTNENGVPEKYLMIFRVDDNWYYNDANNEDTLVAYKNKGWIGYVIEYER